MLQLENRLKASRDFDRVWKVGCFFSTANLKMKIAPNKKNVSRFGFVVSTKISKLAVVRNRIKRQVREVSRLLIKDGQIKCGFDAVILLERGLIDKKTEIISVEVKKIFSLAGLL